MALQASMPTLTQGDEAPESSAGEGEGENNLEHCGDVSVRRNLPKALGRSEVPEEDGKVGGVKEGVEGQGRARAMGARSRQRGTVLENGARSPA